MQRAVDTEANAQLRRPAARCGCRTARSRTAWVRMRWKICTTGACSSTSTVPTLAVGVGGAIPGVNVATTRSSPLNASKERSIARSMSLGDASTKRTVFPVAVRSSSTAATNGPATATTRTSSSIRPAALDGYGPSTRDQDDRVGIGHEPPQVDELEAELLRERVGERALGDESLLDEDLTEPTSGVRLLEQACCRASLVSEPLDTSSSPRWGPLCAMGGAAAPSAALGSASDALLRRGSTSPRRRLRARTSSGDDVFGRLRGGGTGVVRLRRRPQRRRGRCSPPGVTSCDFFERNFICRIGPNWRRRRARNVRSVPRSSRPARN